MIYLLRKRFNPAVDLNPAYYVNNNLTIFLIVTLGASAIIPILRQLRVYFDRKLSQHRYITERYTKGNKVAFFIYSIARTINSPPLAAFYKAVRTVVEPTVLYGLEVQYQGARKVQIQTRSSREDTTRTRIVGKVNKVQSYLIKAARAVVPTQKTSLVVTLIRNSNLPSAKVALKAAKL